MNAPDRPGSPDGRTCGTPETAGQAAYEANAEHDQAEWLHWADGESYDESFDFNLEDMRRAFLAGIQAERDPQQALPMAVAALRTIAWGSTPDCQPIDPSVVADKALTGLKRLGYDEERLADAAEAIAAAAPAPAGEGSLRSELEATVRIWLEESTPYPDEDREDTARRGGFGWCASELAQVLAKHPEQPHAALDLARAETAGIRAAAANTARDLAELRERITGLAEQVTASARATEPSRKSQIEHELAIELRKLLEDQ